MKENHVLEFFLWEEGGGKERIGKKKFCYEVLKTIHPKVGKKEKDKLLLAFPSSKNTFVYIETNSAQPSFTKCATS